MAAASARADGVRSPLAIRLAAAASVALALVAAALLARFSVTHQGGPSVAMAAVLAMAALLAGITLSAGGRRRIAPGPLTRARTRWGLALAALMGLNGLARWWAIRAALPADAAANVITHWLALALALALAALLLGAEVERMLAAAKALERERDEES